MCLFCDIAAGKIPSKVAYEDEEIFAFHDIAPQAPVHILVIPRRHIQSVNELTEADSALLGQLYAGIQKVARDAGVAETGYRVISNVGKDGQQSVPHLHFHVIGGRPLNWNN